MKRISVFGLGYVGCVSAACFARSGHTVIGVDPNSEKVRLVNAGRSPIVEPGLAEVLRDGVEQGRLRATESCEEAIAESDMAFICVGTPGNEHGQLQLDSLREVSRQIGSALRERTEDFVLVVRSTVLPGTTERDIGDVVREAAGASAAQRIRVAVNPEFIREGTALRDFIHPPFTLIGCQDESTAALVEAIYGEVQAPTVKTGIRTAEAIKYVSNSYHALKVCFANEVGDVCAGLGVDAQEVMRIFRMDTKLNVSGAYLRPGFAFGGSCLPKDVKAFRYAAGRMDVATPLLDAIIPSNEGQITRAIERILGCGRRRIGIVGLSFKPGTDDLRESPMVRVVEALIGKGCALRILDSNISVARLTGANRRYINEEIPHISTLMSDDRDALLAHAEVIVVSNDSEETRDVLEHMTADQQLVDLSRSFKRIAATVAGKRVAA